MPYLGKQSEQVGVSIQKYEFLQATDTSSGTTSFSVPSDSGDHVNVWLNGVLLVEGGSDDYSKSNTAITFNSAPADGDIIRIDVVESFALPDALKSSGDTMTGALKLDGGIKQQTSADLSGTYADHQVMLSDSYSVTGDVTISDNLVLAKLSDDSNAVTLTNDTSTRTITGSGSLEASTLVQTPNQSLTAMTGTIGSDVVTTNITKLGTVTAGTFDSLLGNNAKINIQYHFINSGENETTGDHEDLQANISGTQSTDTGFYVFTLNRDSGDSNYTHTLPSGWTAENCLILGHMSNESDYKYKVSNTCHMSTANPAVLTFTPASSYWRNFRTVIWKYK